MILQKNERKYKYDDNNSITTTWFQDWSLSSGGLPLKSRTGDAYDNSDRNTTMNYDSVDRLSSIPDANMNFTYQYYENDLLSKIDQKSGNVQFDYDNGKTKEIKLLKNGASTPLVDTSYGYYSNGKLYQVKDVNTGAVINQYTYTPGGLLKTSGLTAADKATYRGMKNIAVLN